MTAVAGNAWTLTTGIQTSQGTANTAGHMRQAYTGGFGPRPVRDILELAETDASRQSGSRSVVGISITGDSEHYLRPDEFHRDAHLLMGQTSTTGSTTYTHTATPTTTGTAAYATLFRSLNTTTLVDRYVDCQIAAMTVSSAASGAVTYSKSWMGLTPLVGQTDPGLVATSSSPYVYPEFVATFNSVTTDIVQSFAITISQNRTLVLGDTGTAAAAIAPGRFLVTGSMTILFESDAFWRAFQSGTTSGTTVGTTLFTAPLTLTLTRDANTSVVFTMAQVDITAYDPPGNTDGSPISVTMDFATRRQATLAGNLTITTKNQIATVTT